jgi:general secretion pathway protein A
MYEHFFGLNKKPFELAPNPDFLFSGAAYKRALTYLNYAVKEKTGFVMLTGEVGSGKTTLIREFISKLDRQVPVAKVFNTKVSFEQLIAMINDDFGLDSTGRDKVTLLKDLYHLLIEEHGKGRSPILVIDEAQNLTPTVLEEVRMLSNLETRDAKLIQIVLVGQPELAAVLSLDELRQLRQRVSVVCRLAPLTRGECEEYIYHRLAVAGNRQAVQFSSEVLDSIYAYSNGIPRLVNTLCNFILLTAFTEETRTISREMAADIIAELQAEWNDCGKVECTAGKRSLLKALGAAAADDGRIVAPVQGADPSNIEENLRLSL